MEMDIMNVLGFSLFLFYGSVAAVKVKTKEGWVNGQMLVPSTGKGKYYSFKGIPYAAPPVCELRFMPPQPPLEWEGIRNATEHGSVCTQFDEVIGGRIIGRENCLFLNVYTPNINSTSLMPVMFYIHGGYFFTGSGNDDLYAPDFLMGNDVVLVTINYRLDIFGFISVNNKEASGNAGLKDQIAAMKWVKRNIRNFGGDPNGVTIFGDSSGSSCVSLHVVSPAAKGLFSRAIAMSGVYFNDYAVPFEPEKRAFRLGQQLGIDTNDTNILIKCLRALPAEELLNRRPDLLLSDRASASLLTTVYFTPVVEKCFGRNVNQYLTESPFSLIQKRKINQVDLFIGHTTQEGLRNAALITNQFFKYYPIYKEFLVPLKISYRQNPTQVLRIAGEIQNFYFGDQPISLKTIRNLVSYYSYSHFVYDIHAYIESLPKFPNVRRYFYEFSIYSKRNVYSQPGAKKFGIKEATHLDDLGYLFDGNGYNVTVNVGDEAYKDVQLMTKLYTNFAKYGTPTPDDSLGVFWPQYDPKRSAVVIGGPGNFTMLEVSYNENTSIGFWDNLYSKLGTKDFYTY